jgi:Acyltransferase
MSDIQIESPDPNKNLNSTCFCGLGLPWMGCETVMAYPCDHMCHIDCYNKLDDNANKNCELCGEPILRLFGLLDEDIDPQRFADILSMTHFCDMSENSPASFIDSIFDLTTVMARLPFVDSVEDGKHLCEGLFSMNNMTLKVYGQEKLKLEKNKVFISNHTTYYELPIIYYLLNTGFLASSIADDSKIVTQTKKFIPLLTFKRGEKKDRKFNLVDKMRDFVDDNGSICLFPEGLISHPDALIRFRTGAFHIGRPVYAVVIRYPEIIADGYVNQVLYKMGAKKDMTIEVHILGPYYPPFTPEDIDKIQADMAYHGKMVISRVSNRDIKDAVPKNKSVA